MSIVESPQVNGSSRPLAIPEPTLSADFNRLLESGQESDCTLLVGPEEDEFRAHRLVLLSRSPVFAKMFEHDTKESRESLVRIPDLSPEIVAEMLRFVYTGTAPNIENVAIDLLVAADKYQLNRLKTMCENVLCGEICAQKGDLCRILILAHQHSAMHLKVECLRFICAHIGQFLANIWKKCMRNCPASSPRITRRWTDSSSERWPLSDWNRLQTTRCFIQFSMFVFACAHSFCSHEPGVFVERRGIRNKLFVT